MTPGESCPSADEWRQLLTDDLAAEVEAKLAAHLDVCSSCRAEIDRVSREPAWLVARAVDLRDPKRPAESALLHSITELQQSRPPSSAARGAGSAGDELALRFLQPSGQAGSLGRLGRYEILEVVGHGGMGVVFRARDPRLNRIVAIKVMASHVAFVEDARRRFLREAQAAAAINHDNVVTIYAQQPSPLVLPTLPATIAARRPASEASPSIAVLPFGNLSADPDNEYFADGLAEELTNALAQVSGLRVVARTSAFQFKGRALDIREIERRLHVSTVLEGTVRKSQQRMRITAQLIDPAHSFLQLNWTGASTARSCSSCRTGSPNTKVCSES